MIVICGGGIIGLTIAYELLKRGLDGIILIDKENRLGMHASGRNSGVLHAGIYYTPESLKAKLCVQGNLLMRKFCEEKGIKVSETGKVIVTKNEKELNILIELYNRAKENGTIVKLIDEKELREIEPYAKTIDKALFSPLTAVVNPIKIINSLEQELICSRKVKIIKGAKFEKLLNNSEILTSKGKFRFDVFINAAGAYADKVAHSFNVGLNFKILPFKGTYKRLIREKSYMVKGNIYPVPNIRNPFLGVHFTRAHDGTIYIGPTAIPAFGRENYGFLHGIDIESLDIIFRDFILFIKNKEFRRIAVSESRKYIKAFFYKDVANMIKGLKPEYLVSSKKVGIRAQLVDWEKKELVMDFLILKDGNSIHILNAISPAFTSAFAFAKFVVDRYILT